MTWQEWMTYCYHIRVIYDNILMTTNGNLIQLIGYGIEPVANNDNEKVWND